MISGRILIRVANGTITPLPNPLSDNKLYHYRKYINVCGYTEVSITVPYISIYPWWPMAPNRTEEELLSQLSAPSYLVIENTGPLVGGNDFRAIYYSLEMSAHDDFQVRSLGPRYRYIEAPEGVAQMRVRDKGQGYENICGVEYKSFKHLPIAEDLFTVDTLLGRWSYRIQDSTDISPLTTRNPYESVFSTLGLFDYVVSLFRYARGNIQVKYIGDFASTGNVSLGVQPMIGYVERIPIVETGRPENGMYKSYLQVNPTVSLDIPIIIPYDWTMTPNGETPANADSYPDPFFITQEGFSMANFYVRAGRAFQLAFLNPPLANRTMLIPFADD